MIGVAVFPPDTDDLDKLAAFFDQVDSTTLSDLEEVNALPERNTAQESELVSVSLRLLKEDVELIKQLAQHEGLPYTTMIRWVLHRFASSARRAKS